MCDFLPNIPNEQLFYIDRNPYETCVICMDFIQEKDKSILKCGHEFHASCLMENVVKSNNTCPLCREVVSSKTPELPDLNTNVVSSFIEMTIYDHRYKHIKPYIKKICKELNVDWRDLSSDTKDVVIEKVIELLILFGINLGKSISKWIKDGEERANIPADNTTFNIDMTFIDDEEEEEEEAHYENNDEEEEEKVNDEDEQLIEPLFADYQPTPQYMDTNIFIEEFDLTEFRERILNNNYLNSFDNFLNSDIDTFMWPPDGTPFREEPLFSRMEAERIMNSILIYFTRFLVSNDTQA